MPFCPAGLKFHFTVPVFVFYCIRILTPPPPPPPPRHPCLYLAPSHRNVSDPRGQGLGRCPRCRHGHHQRRRRPLRSRGQEGVLHLDKGQWRTWSGEERGGVEGGVGVGGGWGIGVEGGHDTTTSISGFFFSQRFSSSTPLEGRREVKGGEELRGRVKTMS